MKNIYIILLAFAAMFAVSCNDDNLSKEGEGSVTFNINCADTRTQVTDAMLEKLTFRIKSVIGDVETLIRSYSGDEIKDMSIWLIPGEYKVYVEGGDKDVASFDKVYYKGSAEFTVEADVSDKPITVDCYPDNVMIKVVFDDTIKTMVAEDKMTDVKAGIVFKKSDDSNIAAPTLDYTCVKGNDGVASSGVGYFILDNGQDCLDWSLSAIDVSKEGKAIAKSGTYKPADGFKAGYVYTLKFKYSADLGGYINIVVKVDKNLESINQDVFFKPAPQFSGDVVDKTLPVYSGMGDVVYTIKAINELESVKVQINGVDVTAGVTTSALGTDVKECTLTLGSAFTSKLGVGNSTFRIIAVDNTGAQTTYTQKYVGEGIGEMVVTNAWMGAATINAYVTNPNASNPVVYYKSNKDSDYTSVQLTVKDYIGVADATVGGGREYDYYLSYGDTKIGDNAQFTTSGAVIPNGGMEYWSTVNEKVLVPYKGTEQYWDCGNHGSSTMNKNVTTNVTGHNGVYSAYLKSQFVGLGSIGKFAAGNIYIGKYLGTDGMDGGIGYGKPFTFDYKPDKLVVYYKGNVGSADYAGGGLQKGDSDKSQIFVWLCKKSAVNMPYVVCTKKEYQSTFLKADGTYVNDGEEEVSISLKDPITNKEVIYTVPAHSAGDKVEGLVAWGSWSRTQTGVSVNGGPETTYNNVDGWTKIEIPLQYVGTDKPNFLVISCAASAYGDYFAGSTDSYMYVDDFEFVY